MDRLRRLLLEHRRPLAAACTGLAVLMALTAVRQPGDTVPVAVAAADLSSGHVLTDDDLTTTRLPTSAAPARALADAGSLAGRRVGGPMRAGEVFTDARLLAAGPGDDLGPDQVVSTLRLADATAAQGVRVGDRVDVLAVGAGDDGPRASVVAEAVRVVAVPTSSDDEGAPVAVQTTRAAALELARTGLEAQLTVVTVSPGGD